MYFIKKIFVLSIIFEYISNCVSLPNRSTRDIEKNDEPLDKPYIKNDQETLKEKSKQHIVKHNTLEDIDHSHRIQKKTLIYSTNKLLYCIPEKKQIFAIERFMISEENFMCSDKNIEIYFEYHDFFKGHVDTKKGYLSNDTEKNGYCVQETQEHSPVCQKIKRFNIDSQRVLLVINQKFHVLPANKVDETIFNTLKSDYWTYLTYIMIYRFNAYDERNDSFLYWEILEMWSGGMKITYEKIMILFFQGSNSFTVKCNSDSDINAKKCYEEMIKAIESKKSASKKR